MNERQLEMGANIEKQGNCNGWLTDRWEKILFILCAVVIFSVRLVHISELYGVIVMPDEAGYWSHAANMAGLSWEKLLGIWYSYGYSLLLAPLFFISHNMTTLYRIAVVENAILGVIGFILGIKIIKEIQPECGNKHAIAVSFVAASYSAYIFQSQIAWSETFLYTWFMFMLWLCIYFLKKPNVLRGVLFAFSIGFLYIIHNRTVPILVALALFLVLLLWKKQISWKPVIAIIFTLIVIMILNHYIKIGLSQMMWGEPYGFQGNDFATQGSSIKLLFSLDGIKTLFLSLAGKVWYLLVSTLLLGFWGMAYFVKRVWKMLKGDQNHVETAFFFFVLMCSLGVIATATIVMNGVKGDGRIDTLFYGRYSDMIVAPLIMFGLLYLKDCKFIECLIQGVFGIMLLIETATLVLLEITQLDSTYINLVCVPGIYLIPPFNVVGMTIFAVIIGGIIITMFLALQNINNLNLKRFLKSSIFLACVVTFLVAANNIYNQYIAPSQYWAEKNKGVLQMLRDNPEFTVNSRTNSFRYQYGLQAYLPESDVINVDLPIEENNDFFLITNDSIDSDNLDDLMVVEIPSDYNIFVKGEGIIEKLENQGYNLYKMITYDNLDIESKEDRLSVDLGSEVVVNIDFICQENIQYKNTDNIRLSYHIYDMTGNCLVWDGVRTDFEEVNDDTIMQLKIDEDVFSKAGDYRIQIDAISGEIGWFSNHGFETENVYVTVE